MGRSGAPTPGVRGTVMPRQPLASVLLPLLATACATRGAPPPRPPAGDPPPDPAPAAVADPAPAQEPAEPGPAAAAEGVPVEGRSLSAPGPAAEALDDPAPVAAVEAAGRLADDAPVVGVVAADGEARAYPEALLAVHAVVNDALGGEPIAVVWCRDADAAIVYARVLPDEDEPLRLADSGRRWNGVAVLRDRDTGSLWPLLEGRAIRGPRTGAVLEHVPSARTAWADWCRVHPDTLVVLPDAEAPAASAEPSGRDDVELPPVAAALPADARVWGLRVGDVAAALPDDALGADEIRAFPVGGRPLVFVRDAATGNVLVAEARHEGRALVLARLPGVPPSLRLQDVASGETIRFSRLPRQRVDRVRWRAWARSFPETRVLGAVTEPRSAPREPADPPAEDAPPGG